VSLQGVCEGDAEGERGGVGEEGGSHCPVGKLEAVQRGGIGSAKCIPERAREGGVGKKAMCMRSVEKKA
jgi:hypothetical protein